VSTKNVIIKRTKIEKLFSIFFKYRFSVLFINVLFVCFGLAFQLYFGENYFSRFGSVIVCVAIFLLYANQFLDHAHQQIDYTSKRVQSSYDRLHGPELSDATRKEILSRLADKGHYAPEVIKAALPKFEDQKNEIYTARKNIQLLEVSLAISGTLIWGYGDLLFCSRNLFDFCFMNVSLVGAA